MMRAASWGMSGAEAVHGVHNRVSYPNPVHGAGTGPVRQLRAAERAERVGGPAAPGARGGDPPVPALAARHAARQAHPVQDQRQALRTARAGALAAGPCRPTRGCGRRGRRPRTPLGPVAERGCGGGLCSSSRAACVSANRRTRAGVPAAHWQLPPPWAALRFCHPPVLACCSARLPRPGRRPRGTWRAGVGRRQRLEVLF